MLFLKTDFLYSNQGYSLPLFIILMRWLFNSLYILLGNKRLRCGHICLHASMDESPKEQRKSFFDLVKSKVTPEKLVNKN